MGFKSGFVAIIGRPNVGKSTFLNYVLGRKVSIISPKPQTTRNKLQGIYTTDKEQIIFIDTPGIHKPQNKLGNFMNKEAMSSLNDVDMILMIIDGTMDFGTGDQYVLDILKKVETPVVLVVNKIDLAKDTARLEENVRKFKDYMTFDNVIHISALLGSRVDILLNYITRRRSDVL